MSQLLGNECLRMPTMSCPFACVLLSSPLYARFPSVLLTLQIVSLSQRNSDGHREKLSKLPCSVFLTKQCARDTFNCICIVPLLIGCHKAAVQKSICRFRSRYACRGDSGKEKTPRQHDEKNPKRNQTQNVTHPTPW